MKTNKTRGFTLIELMVVIAIISLLSSVVLASIKTAREKAQIIKTVGEMKSLQNALELYRNQFGTYPGSTGSIYADDESQNVWTIDGTLQDSFQGLVTNKFISKIPHAPNYPNNCSDSDCINSGYFLGYIKGNFYTGYDYQTCGRKKVDNYILVFFAHDKKINLPVWELYNSGDGSYVNPYTEDYSGTGEVVPPYFHCLSM